MRLRFAPPGHPPETGLGRVGWDAGVTGCRAGVETASGEQAAPALRMYLGYTFRIPPVKQVGDR